MRRTPDRDDMTTTEAAAELGIRPGSVVALCTRAHRGTGSPAIVAHYDAGLRRWLIPRSELTRYLRERRGPGRPAADTGAVSQEQALLRSAVASAKPSRG